MITTQAELSVFDSPLEFDGSDYTPALDQDRLTDQYHRIFTLMKDKRWRTLAAIHLMTGDPEASISAQLRHMRKPRFGSNTVNSRRTQGDPRSGRYEYQLVPNTSHDPRLGFHSSASPPHHPPRK